jgi:hypothetical protein
MLSSKKQQTTVKPPIVLRKQATRGFVFFLKDKAYAQFRVAKQLNLMKIATIKN